jgi:hypothetical protein
LADALGISVVILGHHGAGGRAVEKRVGAGRGKTFVPIAADAPGKWNETKQGKRAHRSGLHNWTAF